MPAFPRFEIRSFNPGVVKAPSGLAHIAAWQGSAPAAYMRVTGWRTASTPRGYFPTGVTDPSEPRYRVEFSTTVLDLVSLSFGTIFLGLTTAAPSNVDGTAITAPYAGIAVMADTDNQPTRVIYPAGYDGVTALTGSTKDVNAYSGTGTLVVDVYVKSDGKLAIRLDGEELRTGVGMDLSGKVWSHFFVGSLGTNTGTTGSESTGTDYDLRVRAVDLRAMPVNAWNDEGASSPLVMG